MTTIILRDQMTVTMVGKKTEKANKTKRERDPLTSGRQFSWIRPQEAQL